MDRSIQPMLTFLLAISWLKLPLEYSFTGIWSCRRREFWHYHLLSGHVADVSFALHVTALERRWAVAHFETVKKTVRSTRTRPELIVTSAGGRRRRTSDSQSAGRSAVFPVRCDTATRWSTPGSSPSGRLPVEWWLQRRNSSAKYRDRNSGSSFRRRFWNRPAFRWRQPLEFLSFGFRTTSEAVCHPVNELCPSDRVPLRLKFLVIVPR